MRIKRQYIGENRRENLEAEGSIIQWNTMKCMQMHAGRKYTN